MNIYTRAIHFKNGDILTITEEELNASKDAILKGNRWIVVQGELICADTIARIGSHHATAEIAMRDRANEDRTLLLTGRGDVVEERRRLEAEATARHYSFPPESIPTTTNGSGSPLKDALSWRDSNGEVHYS